jgi:hypothetical protein
LQQLERRVEALMNDVVDIADRQADHFRGKGFNRLGNLAGQVVGKGQIEQRGRARGSGSSKQAERASTYPQKGGML